jgi:hypothetical protein
VLVVAPFTGLDEGLAKDNDSRFGLQAGVFTHDVQVAFRAHRALEVGGVVVGDVPSYRADQMPYGGTKESGVGREGVEFAMEDYTYERVMVLTGLELSAPSSPAPGRRPNGGRPGRVRPVPGSDRRSRVHTPEQHRPAVRWGEVSERHDRDRT